MVWLKAFNLGIVFLYGVWTQPAHAGNTTCASSQLDWYTDMVGESPCVTYQRLRQICNQDYQVPNFKSSVPGDLCDDEVVAYQLSMLCMNCQWDLKLGNQEGCDAQQLWCWDKQFPNSFIKIGALANGHKFNGIVDNIRSFSHSAYSRERAGLEAAQTNNNIFTHCPNQIITVSTPTSASNPMSGVPITESATTFAFTSNSVLGGPSSEPPTTITATSNSPSGDATPSAGDNVRHSNHKSHANVGAIVGGVAGAAGAVAIIGGLIVLWRRRKQRHGIRDGENPTTQRHHSYGYRAVLSTSMGEPIGASFGSPALEGFRGNADHSPPAYGSWQPAVAASNPPIPPISSTPGPNVNAPPRSRMVWSELPSRTQPLEEKWRGY
ncbi:hypothetical protein BD311DRAFT_673192 [Dichomitus squalens]|uniref:Transmembrane protein n=1 Tax=Dichomitus squalens TaxID=114155 RepID=A0A4Q9M9H2_9APHY|nr:hypothetical protein BD311DRAFT_673192 [Dichomitus squalens]